MRRWVSGALLLLMALVLLSPATGQAPDAKPDLGANAALKYWTGFALLPALDRKEERFLEDWNKVPLDGAALTLLTRSQQSRAYLHKGANLPHCDWGLEYSEGWRLALPYLPKAMTLARLGALHARHEFEHGHWKAGAKDVASVLQLGRHMEREQMFLPHLVGYRIEAMAIEAAAPYLPELKRDLPEAASAILAAPSGGPSLAQMVLVEKQIMPVWFIHELKEAEQHEPGSWQRVWKEVFSVTEGQEPDFRPDARTLEQAVKMLEDSLPYWDRLARLMALPWKELDAQLPEFFKKTKAENPMAAYFLPAMGKAVAAQRRAQTQWALFKAALVVVEGGQDRLKDIPDPYGDGPFEYRALDRGFELKSKLLSGGKPVTLMVGQRKKE
jgi:hypothetical protein